MLSVYGQKAIGVAWPYTTPLLEAVRTGHAERVIVCKLDRLTRSIRDLAELLELFAIYNCALVSMSEDLNTGSASGRLMMNVLGSVAQWEREAIAERTAAAFGHKRRQHTVYAPTPFGYRRDGDRLVPVRAEQNALREATRMDREGVSFREIGRMFEECDVKPHRGRPWYASSVRALLRSRIATECATDAGEIEA